jgi:hypothetical protein
MGSTSVETHGYAVAQARVGYKALLGRGARVQMEAKRTWDYGWSQTTQFPACKFLRTSQQRRDHFALQSDIHAPHAYIYQKPALE